MFSKTQEKYILFLQIAENVFIIPNLYQRIELRY